MEVGKMEVGSGKFELEVGRIGIVIRKPAEGSLKFQSREVGKSG